jgi:multimeric flavodoxin WrbA
MKKVTIFVGSFRKNGNTGNTVSLLAEVITGKTETVIDVETVYLSEKKIDPCRGCRVCFDKGEEFCPLKDDLLSLHHKILQSDCVILASPVYVNDVSGIMKNFIDRLAFVCHRPGYWNTLFYVITTTGSSPVKHTVRTLQTAVVSWGGQPLGASGFITGAKTPREEIWSDHGRKIKNAAEGILYALARERQKNPCFISLVVFSIQKNSWNREFQKEEAPSVDGQYWKKNGWLDKKARYYFPVQRAGIKEVSAGLAGKVLSRMFS